MGEKEGDMIPERIFPYGDNHFTLNGLLEKPEVLSYLRRRSVEKNGDALRRRLYKGLCDGSITKEVVTEYTQRLKPTPAPRTKPVPIPRKIMSKLRPTPSPRKGKEKPVPPPGLQKPKWLTCDHGITEEIYGVTFCIHCGLEIDHNPLRRGLLREGQAFSVSRREGPIFKRRTESKKSKKEYISVSPLEVPLLVGKEKGKEIKDQILGLLDEN